MATTSKAAAAKNDKSTSDDAAKTGEDVVTTPKPAAGSVKTSTDANDTQVPAPTVAGIATASPENADAPATAGDVEDFGPFQDTAPPVGAAVDAIQDEIDTTVDFNIKDVPLTVTEGDIYVAVRQHNQRNVVDISVAGEVNSAKTIAPYQAKLLLKALQKVVKKIK